VFRGLFSNRHDFPRLPETSRSIFVYAGEEKKKKKKRANDRKRFRVRVSDLHLPYIEMSGCHLKSRMEVEDGRAVDLAEEGPAPDAT